MKFRFDDDDDDDCFWNGRWDLFEMLIRPQIKTWGVGRDTTTHDNVSEGHLISSLNQNDDDVWIQN